MVVENDRLVGTLAGLGSSSPHRYWGPPGNPIWTLSRVGGRSMSRPNEQEARSVFHLHRERIQARVCERVQVPAGGFDEQLDGPRLEAGWRDSGQVANDVRDGRIVDTGRIGAAWPLGPYFNELTASGVHDGVLRDREPG